MLAAAAALEWLCCAKSAWHVRLVSLKPLDGGVAAGYMKRGASRRLVQSTVSYSQAPAGNGEREEKSWSGLQDWRSLPVDRARIWGSAGPVQEAKNAGMEAEDVLSLSIKLPRTLAECGALVLNTPHPAHKTAITHAAWSAFRQGKLEGIGIATAPSRPARPQHPKLVGLHEVPKLAESPLPRAVHMMHNLAHIELNAIDLAWDTLVRFSTLGLEDSFYEDFAHVADDESRHFGWCAQRMSELGYTYGAMVAHDMLWTSATQSSTDLSSRLALVPMSQEARGLDAGPRLTQRLQGMGDKRSSQIVGRIALEEKAHVAVGVNWFLSVSQRLGMNPEMLYRGWVSSISPELLKGPFNHEARQAVGFKREWYDMGLWNQKGEQGTLSEKDLQSLNLRLQAMLEVENMAN